MAPNYKLSKKIINVKTRGNKPVKDLKFVLKKPMTIDEVKEIINRDLMKSIKPEFKYNIAIKNATTNKYSSSGFVKPTKINNNQYCVDSMDYTDSYVQISGSSGSSGSSVSRVSEFHVYITRDFAAGGNSPMNDCLYDLLRNVLGDKMPKCYSTAAKFKIALKIPRKSKVDISHMEQIENELKGYRICVTGDHECITKKDSGIIISITLYNGHYDYRNETYINSFMNYNHERTKVIVYMRQFKNLQIYDVETIQEISYEHKAMMA